uniref:Uncharacterized protein n=1 Tax=Cannabis sativa TaxID=3483 RepID=A0A803NM14_CANSA
MSIQEFYYVMIDLWDQLALTESIELRAFTPCITRREKQRLVQFLMALRSDFEGLRGSILYRSLLPSIDLVVSELLADEIHLKSQSGKGILSTPNSSVLAFSPTTLFLPQENKPRTKFNNEIRPLQFSITATVPSLSSYDFATLSKQFQKFLSTQPNAMYVSTLVGQPPTSTSGMSPSTWVLDYGASHYMSLHSASFISSSPTSSVPVMTTDSTPMPVVSISPVDPQSRKMIRTGRRQDTGTSKPEITPPPPPASVPDPHEIVDPPPRYP